MAAKRSLWRWLTWRLARSLSTIDWTETCFCEVEEEQIYFTIAAETIYLEIDEDEIYYLVEECGMTGDCEMNVEMRPDDKKMRGFDWNTWLGVATITTYSFDVPAGLEKITNDNAAGKTMVLFTGGTPAESYEITGWIEASDGRKDHGTFSVFILPT